VNPLEAVADLIASALGGIADALLQAGRNVQWRNTTRLRAIRPLWGRLGRRLGVIRCSTCGQRFSDPPCSLNRELGWSGHTIAGGIGAAR
jgi:hypothetical protein